MSDGSAPTASGLYRECMEAAHVCIQRAKDGTVVGERGDEYASVAIKSNAQAALSLIQAAVTLNKAAQEAKTERASAERSSYRRRSA